MKLRNSKEINEELGRGNNYLWLMKQAGYRMAFGNRDTLENVLAWLHDHPEFRTTEYLERQRKKEAKA